MKIEIDYGKIGLEFFPNQNWNVEIITPKTQQPYPNPIEAIKQAILNPIGIAPLSSIIKNKRKIERVCIVVSDATRPVPSHLILEALVSELNNHGISDEKITVLIATGLHRPSKLEEHNHILGASLYGRVKIIDHDSTDQNSLKKLAALGHNFYINKYYCESDLKIVTGYVEPHFFFGFSGGRKSIIPGIAGVKTIQENHSAENIDSEFSRFGIFRENLMHKQALEAVKLAGVDFSINVCINQQHQITIVAAGDIEYVHEKLVAYQFEKSFHPIKDLYDVVICGNGGYPLDLNLYQAVKSMAIGEMAVKQGGTIISVNECIEGVGIGQEKFKELLFSGMTPKEIYQKIMNGQIYAPDQWEIQVLARILRKAEIYIISSLDKGEIGNIGLKYARSIEEAVKNSIQKYGSEARILVLPNGPQVLPLFTN